MSMQLSQIHSGPRSAPPPPAGSLTLSVSVTVPMDQASASVSVITSGPPSVPPQMTVSVCTTPALRTPCRTPCRSPCRSPLKPCSPESSPRMRSRSVSKQSAVCLPGRSSAAAPSSPFFPQTPVAQTPTPMAPKAFVCTTRHSYPSLASGMSWTASAYPAATAPIFCYPHGVRVPPLGCVSRPRLPLEIGQKSVKHASSTSNRSTDTGSCSSTRTSLSSPATSSARTYDDDVASFCSSAEEEAELGSIRSSSKGSSVFLWPSPPLCSHARSDCESSNSSSPAGKQIAAQQDDMQDSCCGILDAMREAESACSQLRLALELVEQVKPFGHSLWGELRETLDAIEHLALTEANLPQLVQVEKRLVRSIAAAKGFYFTEQDSQSEGGKRLVHVMDHAVVDKAITIATSACTRLHDVSSSLKAGAACTNFASQELREAVGYAANRDIVKIHMAELLEISHFKELTDLLSQLREAAGEFKVSSCDLQEADRQRRRLHLAIQDLKGQVRVFCRLRDLANQDSTQTSVPALEVVDEKTVKMSTTGCYSFDQVFAPGSQDQVFEECRDLIQSALDGRNVTIFTYGQTGSGKTYTMYGTPEDEGIAPRAIRHLFDSLQTHRVNNSVMVTASMLQLYRNNLSDLLSDASPQIDKLSIKYDKDGSVQVQGLSEVEVADANEMQQHLQRGVAQRATAAHAMNNESSRSHLIFTIKVRSVNSTTGETIKGKILLCDLAGAERIKKTEVQGERQKEAIDINTSLAALGKVIVAVARKEKRVPYRDHKLTQIMSDSLGGTAKTLMIVNASQRLSDLSQTASSLEYAARASRITNKNSCAQLCTVPSR